MAIEKSEYVRDIKGTFFEFDTDINTEKVDAFTYEVYACHIFAEDFVRANEASLLELVASRTN